MTPTEAAMGVLEILGRYDESATMLPGFDEVVSAVVEGDVPAIYRVAGLPGAYWAPLRSAEVIMMAPDIRLNLESLYCVVHEVVHINRKRRGLAFYERPVAAHRWETICAEEDAVNGEAYPLFLGLLEGTQVSLTEARDRMEHFLTLVYATYNPAIPTSDWHLGLAELGLTRDNADTAEIDPEVVLACLDALETALSWL